MMDGWSLGSMLLKCEPWWCLCPCFYTEY